MPEIKKYDDEIRIKCTKEFKRSLTAVAGRRGETLSDLCRSLLEAGISLENASEGIDSISSILRKVVREQNKTFEDRLAAMIYKDTVSSATSMNLLLLLAEQMGHDALGFYHKANAKAVAYVNNSSKGQK